MVIVVVITHQKMRSVTNFFLANLAFADFCVGIFCVYQNLSIYLVNSWIFGDFMCKMYNFIQNMSYTASITILMIISIERYLAIVYPMKSKQILTMGRLKAVIIIVWIVSAGYNVPKLFMYETTDINNTGTVLCLMLHEAYDEKTYDLVNFFLWYVSPLFFMTILYSIIGIKLWKSSAVIIKSPGHHGKSFPMKRLFTNQSKSVTEQNSGIQAAVTFQNGKINTSVDSSYYVMATPEELKQTCKGKKENNNSNQDTNTEPEKDVPTKANVVASSGSPKQRSCKQKRFMFRRKANLTKETDNSNQNPNVSVHSSVQNIKARRKVIKLLVVIILSFALCLLPYHARKLWRYLASGEYYKMTTATRLFTPISFIIMYMNSGLNPIIYAFLSDNFRRSMRDVFCCRRKINITYMNSEVTSLRRSSTLTHSVASLA